jgi:O-antigen/teichoic acid export membrane protein
MSYLINDYADRFLIKYFAGSAQVGIYSVGYNLASYVQAFMTAPLWMAIFPIYTKIWEREGRDATANFLSTLLNFYVALAALLMVVVSCASQELIVVLAGDKFASAGEITPFIIVSTLICGATHITGAGFYLSKRTHTIALWTLGCAGFNVALNLFLIPRFGILGAAYATLLSSLALTMVVTFSGRQLLCVRWPVRDMVDYIVAALAAAAAASRLHLGSPLLSMLLKIAVATVLYTVIVLTLNRSLRTAVLGQVRRALSLYRQHAAAGK